MQQLLPLEVTGIHQKYTFRNTPYQVSQLENPIPSNFLQFLTYVHSLWDLIVFVRQYSAAVFPDLRVSLQMDTKTTEEVTLEVSYIALVSNPVPLVRAYTYLS